jgi:hypothetical protein
MESDEGIPADNSLVAENQGFVKGILHPGIHFFLFQNEDSYDASMTI